MRIAALCKTFAGQEWIEAMTKSIYPYVEKIVFVNSEISWSGRHGNKCKTIIQKMKIRDTEDKIISLDYDTIDQFAQCMYGYRWIQDNLSVDFVMLIDTDEVWDAFNLERAIKFLENNPQHAAYRHRMYTYVKSPLYRIDPIEPLTPVSFVSSKMDDLGKDFRSCDLPWAYIKWGENMDQDVFYHHYVYVRTEFNTILEKIITSHVSENKEYIDMSIWIPEVWNQLPHIYKEWWHKGWHPAKGFRGNWRKIKVINKDDMPDVLRNNDFDILKNHCKGQKI